MNGFWSPTTTTWPTIGLARIGSSSAAGETFAAFARDKASVAHLPPVEADYLARIVAHSLAAYEELTGAWLADNQLGIARIATTFALKALKDFEGYPLLEE